MKVKCKAKFELDSHNDYYDLNLIVKFKLDRQIFYRERVVKICSSWDDIPNGIEAFIEKMNTYIDNALENVERDCMKVVADYIGIKDKEASERDSFQKIEDKIKKLNEFKFEFEIKQEFV